MPRLLDTPLAGFDVPADRPQAALIIVHGLAEYAGRYGSIARTFAGRGISCFAYDQYGHGDAPGVRTHVDRFDRYVEDLHTVIAAVRRHCPDLPLFLWGHSMGSIVVALAALNPDGSLRGAITSSCSLDVFSKTLNPLSLPLRIASRLLPRVRIPLGLDGAKISGDEAVQHAYVNDPRIPQTASLRLLVEFAAACERCRTEAVRISLPWLVTHGADDAIAPASGSRTFYDLLSSTDKQLDIRAGLRHEMHNERAADRNAFLESMAAWVLQRARREA